MNMHIQNAKTIFQYLLTNIMYNIQPGQIYLQLVNVQLYAMSFRVIKYMYMKNSISILIPISSAFSFFYSTVQQVSVPNMRSPIQNFIPAFAIVQNGSM